MTTPVQLARAWMEDHIETVADYLLPGGKTKGAERHGMRKAQGGPGDSVCIHIARDEKLGMCKGFASGERGTGNILETWMRLRNIPEGDWERFFTDLQLYAGQDFGYHKNGSNQEPKPFTDWEQCVQKVTDEDLKHLALDWRGSFSVEYAAWLRDQKLIGRYHNKKFGTDHWAFPVINSKGELTSIHYLKDETVPPGQRPEWFYESKGFPVALFVIGDLSKVEYVHAFESQWDMFSVDAVLGVHASKKWALVATRGSGNAKLLADLPPNIKGVMLWTQNDEAGQKWEADAASFANGRSMKAVRLPKGFKDVAELIESGADRDLVEKLHRDAVELDSPPPKATPDPGLKKVQDEEAAAQARRFQALSKATVKGSELLEIEIPPRQIILKDWFKEGDLGFIFAYRGSGKTWFAMWLTSALTEGQPCGPWSVHEAKQWPVLYVDGEMPADDIRGRIKAINGGQIPEHFHLLNHEILYSQSELVLNLASKIDQGLITQICVQKGIKVLVLDNLGCLFTGVGENDADEWEKVLPWLLELRRTKISVVIIHHTGVNTTRMRGTSKREDAAAWVMRLDDKKEGTDQPGTNFVSRLVKYRGCEAVPDYEWTIKPAGAVVTLGCKEASRSDALLQHIQSGIDSNKELGEVMGLPNWTISKMAKILVDKGKIKKSKRGHYELV